MQRWLFYSIDGLSVSFVSFWFVVIFTHNTTTYLWRSFWSDPARPRLGRGCQTEQIWKARNADERWFPVSCVTALCGLFDIISIWNKSLITITIQSATKHRGISVVIESGFWSMGTYITFFKTFHQSSLNVCGIWITLLVRGFKLQFLTVRVGVCSIWNAPECYNIHFSREWFSAFFF